MKWKVEAIEPSAGAGGTQISRRSLVRVGVGAAAVIATPLSAPSVWAKNYPSLGTYPAGVEGKSVFVGGLVPLTGPYASSGQDMKKGIALAVEHINNGSRVTEAVPSLKKGGGLLGKKLEYGISDTQTEPNPAVQAAIRFIDDKKAIVLVGGVSSSSDVALEKVAQRKKVIYLVGISASDTTTGIDCQRFGFRLQPPAYMMAKALAPVLAKQVGKNRKAAYLVPDYVAGHSEYRELTKFSAAEGWKTITQQVVPLGSTDFSSYLLNVANSGADVFLNLTFGADQITSTKQAMQFGILKKMKYVIPIFDPFAGEALGPEVLAGVYGYQPWWWSEEDIFPLAKYFVEDFQKKHHHKPGWGASGAYNQLIVWADAVSRAGTFYPGAVIKELESGHKVDTIYGKVWYRAGDHQGVQGVPVMVGKTAKEMRSKTDYYRIVEIVPGEQALPPLADTGCHMPSIHAA